MLQCICWFSQPCQSIGYTVDCLVIRGSCNGAAVCAVSQSSQAILQDVTGQLVIRSL